jgi:hypothetical protein
MKIANELKIANGVLLLVEQETRMKDHHEDRCRAAAAVRIIHVYIYIYIYIYMYIHVCI